MSDDEIERIVKDAEANAESDKKRREEADLRNEVDQLIFTTNKTVEELRDNDNISADEIEKAEAARDELQEAVEANDLDLMKEKRDNLNEVVQNLSVKLYEQAAQQAQAQGDAEDTGADSSSTDDDNIVDADFEEVD